jgi:bis(5'-nucleosyl)-tetraphosphatase (symmetrical)
MATYAIGDVQGCMRTLERLLARLAYDPRQDRLWLAGDLVNRGPHSCEVLRWAMGQGDRVVCVLGNHELHLLGCAAGVRAHKGRDTFDDVLAASDRDDLLAWVRTRPLAHREGPYLMVHAGLWPTWTADTAMALADDIATSLRSGDELLAALAGMPDRAWDEAATGLQRTRDAAVLMTTLRMIGADGKPLRYNGAPGPDAPAGARPWHDVPGRRSEDMTILYGHWAAQGFVQALPRFVALDSGCVWGRALTALRLDDLAVIQVPAADGASED